MKQSSRTIIEEVDRLLESGLPHDSILLLEKLMEEEELEFEIALRYSLALKRAGKDEKATE